jgi:kynurenine formamidase
MIANTGTYLDAPFHHYSEGADLADLPLPSLATYPESSSADLGKTGPRSMRAPEHP